MKRILVSAAIAAVACDHPTSARPRSNVMLLSANQIHEMGITVETVSEQPIDNSVGTSGRVTWDDMRVAHVFSPVSGRLVRMDAKLGQHVKRGETLALMQSPDVSQASSDLSKANADLVAAEHDLKRKKALFTSKAGSAADLEASEDTYVQARAEMERAQQKAALFRAGRTDAVTQGYALIAPIDGEVVARYINPGVEVTGQYGGGGPAAELYTIGELDSVWVLANLYETDIPRVAIGDDVDVKVVAYPDRTFKGKVDWVSSALEPATRTAKVRCTFENVDRSLRPEMYGNVRILVPARSLLAVSREAVVPYGEQQIVFGQSAAGADGSLTIERLPLAADLERPNGRWVPVLHGLEAGQKVVVHGADQLSQVF